MTHTQPTQGKKRAEGMFYLESDMPYDCCENCGDVHFEKTYPAHTAYYACRNLKCPCHSPTQGEKECACGHWKSRHERTGKMCDVGGCGCEEFVPQGEKIKQEIVDLKKQIVEEFEKNWNSWTWGKGDISSRGFIKSFLTSALTRIEESAREEGKMGMYPLAKEDTQLAYRTGYQHGKEETLREAIRVVEIKTPEDLSKWQRAFNKVVKEVYLAHPDYPVLEALQVASFFKRLFPEIRATLTAQLKDK